MFNPDGGGVRSQQVQRYYGKYPGIVLNNEPPEDAPHRGELLVRVPGILEETPDGTDTRSIEVIAKPCFLPGFFFIPEVDDEVWVEFAAGDINSPLWTGVWYPTEQTPQTVASEPPTEFQKVIRTASGHVIQLDDTEGEEQIVVSHPSGAMIKIDSDGSVLLANQNSSFVYLNAKDGELTIGEEHGHLITMTSDSMIITNTDGKVSLELKGGKLIVLGHEAVEIMASKVQLEGTTITLGGSAAIEPAVLGNLFMALYNAHTHATALGPSGPPLPPLTPVVMSKGVRIGP